MNASALTNHTANDTLIVIRASFSSAHIKDIDGLKKASCVALYDGTEDEEKIGKEVIYEATTTVAHVSEIETEAAKLGATIEKYGWGEWTYGSVEYDNKTRVAHMLWND
jgi:hypothetical protein